MAKKVEADQTVSELLEEVSVGRRVPLSNGQQLTIKPVFGRELRKAQLITKGNPDGLLYALMAQGVELDGKPVLYEDLDEMDAFLVLEIMAAFMEGREGNFTSQTPGQ